MNAQGDPRGNCVSSRGLGFAPLAWGDIWGSGGAAEAARQDRLMALIREKDKINLLMNQRANE